MKEHCIVPRSGAVWCSFLFAGAMDLERQENVILPYLDLVPMLAQGQGSGRAVLFFRYQVFSFIMIAAYIDVILAAALN